MSGTPSRQYLFEIRNALLENQKDCYAIDNAWDELESRTKIAFSNQSMIHAIKDSEAIINQNIDVVTVDAVSCFPSTRLRGVFRNNKEVFVHANIISMSNIEPVIAIQLPSSEEAKNNFWLAHLQHKLRIIVNLAMDHDGVRQIKRKATPFAQEYIKYWPDIGAPLSTPDLTVTQVEYTGPELPNTTNHRALGIEIMEFIIQPKSKDIALENNKVYLVRFKKWLEARKASTEPLSTTIDIVETLLSKLDSYPSKGLPQRARISVHCRASAGRSGAFIATWELRSFIDKLANNNNDPGCSSKPNPNPIKISPLSTLKDTIKKAG